MAVSERDALQIVEAAPGIVEGVFERYPELKIVLIDNSQLGMVRQWQELFFEENFSEIDLSDNPDFSEVAHAFGIEAFTIDHREQVELARLDGVDRQSQVGLLRSGFLRGGRGSRLRGGRQGGQLDRCGGLERRGARGRSG